MRASEETPSLTRDPARRTPGLRLQLIFAIGSIMVLAFVPLFVAIASLTDISVSRTREAAARDNAELAARLACAKPDPFAMQRVIDAANGRIVSLAVRDGDLEYARATTTRPYDTIHVVERHVRCDSGRDSTRVIEVRMRERVEEEHGSVLHLVALYMAIFALALLVFLYFSMTRLIVRPIERLVQASERVAAGGRQLDVPRTGPRELVELGRAVQTMTTRLLGEEEALRSKVDELTKTTARLSEARDQVTRSDRLASVGRLAAGLAHEVGNPLAALLGLEDLLLTGDLAADEQQDFLARMKRETERIHGVMRDLLDYARTDGPPSVAPVREPARVEEVLTDVARLVLPQKTFRRVQVTTSIEPASLTVQMAPAKLTQVTLNLVMNAAQAIAELDRDGNIHLSARPSDDDKSVVITVTDDGPGVSAAVRDRVFEPFVTTKATGEGTGLGLAVCRGLVESAGGTLDFHDGEKSGTVFEIFLPSVQMDKDSSG